MKADAAEVTPESVADALARVLSRKPSASTPDEEELAELTRWINVYCAQPWTEESVARYREADRKARQQREILDQAAVILQGDLTQYRQSLEENSGWEAYVVMTQQTIANIEQALVALKAPRGWMEQGLPRMSKTGANPRPWTVAARKLAAETLLAIQKAQRRNGARVQSGFGDADGPVVKAVRLWLVMIYKTDIPSRSTILEALDSVARRGATD